MNRPALGKLAVWTMTALAATAFVLPVWFMIAASFRPNEIVLSGGLWTSLLPTQLTLENYRQVMTDLQFGRFMANSLIIVTCIVIAGLVINSAAGYALARLKFPGRSAIVLLVLAVLIMPFEALAVPLFFMMSEMGWVDTYRAQIIPFIANPFSIFLFYTFFRELPEELEEAARMDGAGTLRVFVQIMAPLAVPAYAAVAILTFLLHWGSYLWPLMVTLGTHVQPLPVALGNFTSRQPVPWGDVMAFGTLAVLPVVIVFLLLQRWFVRGVATSGLKG